MNSKFQFFNVSKSHLMIHLSRIYAPCKSRNHIPKKILPSMQVGYLRWRNILLEGYQILMKKGWKGLVGHPNDRRNAVTFLFHFIFCTFSFSRFSFHLCLFLLFLTAIDLVICVSVRNFAVSLWQVCSCLSLEDALAFSHFDVSLLLVMYLYTTHWGQCVIQVWGYEKTLCPFVCLFLVAFLSRNFWKEKKIVLCCCQVWVKP